MYRRRDAHEVSEVTEVEVNGGTNATTATMHAGALADTHSHTHAHRHARTHALALVVVGESRSVVADVLQRTEPEPRSGCGTDVAGAMHVDTQQPPLALLRRPPSAKHLAGSQRSVAQAVRVVFRCDVLDGGIGRDGIPITNTTAPTLVEI